MPLDDFTWGAGTGTAGRATGPPTPLVPGRGGGSAGPGVLSGVDPDLHRAMASAFATVLPPGFRAVMTSGVRSGDPSSQHATGHAEDWHIYDNNGNDISNRGPDVTRLYRNAAVQGLLNLQYINPQKAQQFGWGNYFETEKGSGQRDIMHYDLGGARASPGFGDPQEVYREAAAAKQKFATTPSVAAPTAPATPEQPEQQAPQWPTTKPWETQQPDQQQPPSAQPAAPPADVPASSDATPAPAPAAAQPQWPATPPWQQQQQAPSPAPPATSQDATPQWPTSPPWEKPTEAASPAAPQWPTSPPWETQTAPAAPQPSVSRATPVYRPELYGEPEVPSVSSFASLLPALPTGQELGSEASAGTAAPGAVQPAAAPQPEVVPPPALPVPAELGSEASMGTAAPGAVQPAPQLVLPEVSVVYPAPAELGSEASMGTAAPGAVQPAAPPAQPQPPYPVPAELGSEASMGTAAPGAEQPAVAQPALSEEEQAQGIMPDQGAALGAGLGRSFVTGIGQLAAGPGNIVQGGSATVASQARQRASNQVDIMDRIDRGETPPIPATDMVQQSFAGMYRDATPEQRTQIRQQVEGQIANAPPIQEEPYYKTFQTIGQTLAAPGDWVTRQGEKITPPAGYEDALSTKIGAAFGSAPVYVVAGALGGLPALVGVAGMQTYSQSYQENLKAGYAPEDAAVDAALKSVAGAGIMAFPMAHWLNTLSGVEKRVFLAAVTRMGQDGLFMASAQQAQQLVNNIIDKAQLNPDQSLTAGVGDPKDIAASALFGAAAGLPHAVGAGVHQAAVNRREEIVRRWLDATKQQREAPETPAPAPDNALVKQGITTVPNTDQGQTLVRATDSLGNSWIGHSGVLVNEGHNPTVDQHFKDAEQTQPVQTNTDLKATKAIDDLVTSTHVDATQGITWTGAYEGEAPKDENGDPVKDQNGNALTGQVMVVGHDAEGHAVEIPEERYAVLGQYGDLNHDTYLMARPGENPLVAVRDPNTGFVYAIAQGHPPANERLPDHLTLEEQDAQNKTQGQPPETLTSAVRVGGKIYTGATHGEAYDQALRENGGVDPGSSKADRNLFVRADGSVVSFEEAQGIRKAEEQNAQGQPHPDSPENLSLANFTAAVHRGRMAPSEDPGFSRIERNIPTSALRSDDPGRSIDQGLHFGYSTDDIAKFLAHHWAARNDPAYRQAIDNAVGEGTAPADQVGALREIWRKAIDDNLTDKHIAGAHQEMLEEQDTAGARGPTISNEPVKGEAPIVRFRQDAAAIQAALPPVADGYTRLWRGNRPGEIGTARQFTNDLPGIALPFREAYGHDISYVDVPTTELAQHENKAGAAPGAEFSLPPELAAQAKGVNVAPGGQPLADRFQQAGRGRAAMNMRRQPNIVPPDITDRPSLYRRAFRDLGYDPDVMVNKPVQDQIDVLSAGLKRIYGFKDVVVDPKAQPQKVIDTLLDAHHNLQWMAHALGYSEKAMSLDGTITLRLEPLKSVRKDTYLGLYDPNTKSIHMPDRSNSFAHEWTHALDHALIDKLANHPVGRGSLLSSRTRAGALETHVRPGSPEEGFARVMNAIFHDHALEAARVADLNAKAAQGGKAGQAAAAEAGRIVAGARTHQTIGPTAFRMGAQSRYHARPEELLARAGEAFVAHLVDVLGAGNEFITKGDRAYLDQATQRFNDLYPHGPDRDAIFKAMQDFHQVLQRNQILGHDPRASVPSDHDILDPIHWRNLAEPQANPALAAGLKKPIVAYTSWRQRMLAGLETTAARMGAEKVPRWSRQGILRGALTLKDVATPYAYSNMGQLGVYHERYENLGNHAAARVIGNVMDKLGYRYAEGRLQATPFERLANRLAQSHVNKLDAILRNNGIDTARISAQTDRQLWDALRGRDTGAGPIPANVQRAAGEVRALLNDFWYQVERGGIPVGMPRDEGYVPIAFDHDKITADGQKAHATISNAMAVDFEVKQRQQNGAFIHEAYGDLNRKNLPQSINDGMTKLGQVQEQMRNETDPQKLADLDRQQQQLLAQLHDPIRDAWAKQRADDWVYALNDVPWGYKNAGGTLPSANPLKNRVLSAEARDIMAENGYILTRPSELLPYYFHQLSRKIAFNQTFGAKGEVLDKVMNDLMAAGVPREDRVEIKRSIESSIGILTSNEVSTGHQFATWARGLYTIGLMGRAAWSTVAEPMVATMQTGSFKAGFHGFTTSTRALLADLNLLKPNERIEHLRDIANVLGVTSTRLSEAMLTGRTAGLLGSPGRLMSNAYRRSGLTYVTNANKVGAIASADAALKIWGKQIINQRRGSLFDPHGELRELGIPNSEHAEFAKWVTSRDEMPSLDEMTQTPMGQRWAEAVQRFVEKTVIEPIASEKARGANSALGRWIYGLQSYNFGFQRAVLNPFFNRWFTTMAYERGRLGKVQGTLSGTAKWAGYAATSLAGMMMIQLPTTMLRQLLFDTDRTNQWLEDGSYIENIMALAFSRIGLGGVADPLINAISHVRYEHEISSLALGAQANVFAESLQDIVGWATGGGSAETNTSEYRMLRGLWTLIGMPVSATVAAALPGGPRASYLLSLLGQYGTSMTASDLFARSIAGAKGESSKPLTREQQQQRYYHPQPKQKQGSEAGAGSLASGLLGIADDFAVPALRGVGQFLARRL